MKIAIPVDENNMQTNICVSFGRTPYFLVYDTETGAQTFIKNEAANAQGGAGIKAAQEIVNSGAVALIAPRMGQNAATVITAGNIKIYKSNGNSLIENINEFKAGKLIELDNIHPGFHNGGN